MQGMSSLSPSGGDGLFVRLLERARTWASAHQTFSFGAAIVIGAMVLSVPFSAALTGGQKKFDYSSADAAEPGYALTANPNPVKVCAPQTTGTVLLSWVTPGPTVVEVRRGMISGPVVATSRGAGQAQITGISNGEAFYLTTPFYSQTSSSSQELVVESSDILASVIVRHTSSGCATATPPPPVTQNPCDATGISVASATASTFAPSNPPSLAVDGRTNTFWSSNFAPQWIQLDLGAGYDLTGICVHPNQFPAGVTRHEISAGGSVTSLSQIALLNENLTSGQWKYVPVRASGAKFVKILTTNSPSWVAWNEIKVFGSRSFGGDVPPPSGSCPTASVVANYASLAVGDRINFDSSMPMDFNTLSFTSSNYNVIEVAGTVGVVRSVGSATINGQGFSRIAGKFCPLSPITITVNNPVQPVTSSLSAFPNPIQVCRGNAGATVLTAYSSVAASVEDGNTAGDNTLFTLRAGETRSYTLGQIPVGGFKVVKLFRADNQQLLRQLNVYAQRDTTPGCDGYPLPDSTITASEVLAACSASLPGTANGVVVVNNSSASATLTADGANLFTVAAGATVTRSGVALRQGLRNGDTVRFSLVQNGGEIASLRVIASGNSTCSPTGTITPGVNYVSTCSLQGRPASVTLTATITSAFGEGDIVLGNGSDPYQGTAFGYVRPGSPISFTVDAARMGLYSGVTFNIRTPGGQWVEGAGAVVYRDDRNCPGGVVLPGGSLSITSPSTDKFYQTCASIVPVTVVAKNTSPSNGPSIRFSGDGTMIAPGQTYTFVDQVSLPADSATTKTYNTTYTGSTYTDFIVAHDYITLRRIACGDVSATPQEVVVYFGTVGYTNITATNNSQSEMILSGDGVNQIIMPGQTYSFMKQVMVGDAPRTYVLSNGLTVVDQVTVTVRKN